jgi:hypothetical protein
MSTSKRQIVFPKEWLLARFTARFSLFAPFVAFALLIFLDQSGLAEVGWQRIGGLALAVCVVFLPVLGLVSGIVALVTVKHYSRIRYGRATSCMAVAGTVLCGIYILFIAFIVWAASQI